MGHFISEAVREACRDYDVRIDPLVALGFYGPIEIGVEGPVDIGPGSYDVDLIGAFTYLGGRNSHVRHVNMIGRFCAIAPGVMIGEVEHPTDFLSAHPLFQARWVRGATEMFQDRNRAMIDKSRLVADALYGRRFGKIVIGNDVWIGEGAYIRRGVEIGDGAIVAARSVVTGDVPPYAIVAGSPARVIRYRFAPDVVETLLDLQWWRYGLSALDSVDFTDIDLAIRRIGENIASGRAEPYRGMVLGVAPDSVTEYRFDDAEAAA